MAILFERNGDWPISDEDYRKTYEKEDEDACFFCDRPTGCICDEVYDFQQEQALMDEFDNE